MIPDNPVRRPRAHRLGIFGLLLLLLGDSPDRIVRIYLPSGYNDNPNQRYPVIYLLHGYTGTSISWELLGSIQRNTDALIEQGTIRPMIVVMPDALNKYRGIAGHSMGGFGAFRLAMLYPETYSAVYDLSACCLGFVERQADGTIDDAAWRATLQFASTDFTNANLTTQSHIAASAVMSPNPENPPFYVDFPFELVEGEVQIIESVWNRWAAQMPFHMLPQYVDNLRQFRGIRFDVGRSDRFAHIIADSRALSAALDQAGIDHVFEEYDGNHLNRIGQRIETTAWPFFSTTLNFEKEPGIVEESTWGIVKSGFQLPWDDR